MAASPQRVWRAWTDAAELAAWFWPDGFDTVAELDLRPGGGHRLESRVAGIGLAGEYLRVEAPAVLEFTWQWDGEAERTVVEVTLEAIPAGTVLTVVHRGFVTEDDRAIHATGWRDCLDRLPAHLAAD
ncbi:MAG: SRPBCC domain-containing protein [Propionicimonas sp.]|nr:SRPBCC domain-containing protein [Propionicimonas sp.]